MFTTRLIFATSLLITKQYHNGQVQPTCCILVTKNSLRQDMKNSGKECAMMGNWVWNATEKLLNNVEMSVQDGLHVLDMFLIQEIYVYLQKKVKRFRHGQPKIIYLTPVTKRFKLMWFQCLLTNRLYQRISSFITIRCHHLFSFLFYGYLLGMKSFTQLLLHQ